MKFGQHLEENQFEPWKNEYIQYNELKHYLKTTQISSRWNSNHEGRFSDRIEQEFQKIKKFTEFKMNQIAEDMKPERINDLIKFIQINTTGFQKIIKKHDKWTALSLHPQLVDIVKQLDEFIVQLSLQQQWTTTRKYWVHPDYLKEVEAVLLFNLPLKYDNTPTNTIYLDNSNTFHSYCDILQHKNLAKLIRARWYGSESSDVQIEKKTYHESYFKNKGIYTKDVVQLPHSHVSSFLLTGSYQGPCPEQAEMVYDEARQLRSILRCSHSRKTYQTNDPHFRITLDTNIILMKEMGLDWKHSHVAKEDTIPFPFSVLEIKSSSANKSLPPWITKGLLHLLYEVPFFSKYLHGTSHFFSDRVPMLPWWLNEMQKDIRKKPSYIAPQELASSCTVVVVEDAPSFYAYKLKQWKATDEQNHVSMTRWLYAKLTCNLDSLLQDKKKAKRIEPKVHFANERTFISWLQFSALLLAVSLGLINFGDHVSKGSGAFFIVVAMVLACYAELRFQYRSWQIRFRFGQRFDDMLGPAILCFVFIVALLVNLGLRLGQPLPVEPSLFGYNVTSTNGTVEVDKHGYIYPTDQDEP